MTNTQNQETKNKTVQREMFNNTNLAKFYSGIWGNYHSKIKSERKAAKKEVDRVTIGLGLSALALNSCASFEDTYASRPEAFQNAYPEQEQSDQGGLEVEVEKPIVIKDATSIVVGKNDIPYSSATTSVDLSVPKNNDPYGLSPMHLLVMGATLIGGLVVAYILYDPKKKTPKQSNPPTNTGGQ